MKSKYEAPKSLLYKVQTGNISYKNVDTRVTRTTMEEKEKFLNDHTNTERNY